MAGTPVDGKEEAEEEGEDEEEDGGAEPGEGEARHRVGEAQDDRPEGPETDEGEESADEVYVRVLCFCALHVFCVVCVQCVFVLCQCV